MPLRPSRYGIASTNVICVAVRNRVQTMQR